MSHKSILQEQMVVVATLQTRNERGCSECLSESEGKKSFGGKGSGEKEDVFTAARWKCVSICTMVQAASSSSNSTKELLSDFRIQLQEPECIRRSKCHLRIQGKAHSTAS